MTWIEFLNENYIPYEVEWQEGEQIIFTNDEDLLPFEEKLKTLFPDFKFDYQIEISKVPNSPNK